MRALFAGAYAAFVLSLSMPAVAQTAPPARIEITVYDTRSELRGLSGELLPLAPAIGQRRHDLKVRTYTEQTMASDELEDAALGSTSHVEVAEGAGYSRLTVDQIMGDVHAVAGFTGPSPNPAVSEFSYGSNVVLTLPARSVLTLTGKIDVKREVPHEMNYATFERRLISVADGTTGGVFVLDPFAPLESFSISAVNPLDVAATFYYYSSVGGFAFSVNAVPEPSSAAMAAAGMLLIGTLLRRRRRRSTP